MEAALYSRRTLTPGVTTPNFAVRVVIRAGRRCAHPGSRWESMVNLDGVVLRVWPCRVQFAASYFLHLRTNYWCVTSEIRFIILSNIAIVEQGNSW